MDDGRYRGGGTRGGKWGCGFSLLITLPIFTILLMVEALGDCAPDIPCGKVLVPCHATIGAGCAHRRACGSVAGKSIDP